jgi:hypothetical protein
LAFAAVLGGFAVAVAFAVVDVVAMHGVVSGNGFSFIIKELVPTRLSNNFC